MLLGVGAAVGLVPVMLPVTPDGWFGLVWSHCGIWQHLGSFGSGTMMQLGAILGY